MADHAPATLDSWKTEPFEETRDIPFRATFTADEVARLRHGLIPRAMEDKWFVCFEHPSLMFHRSWTGQGVYRVDFASNGQDVGRAVCAETVLGESGDVVHHAKLLGFLIGNLMLGRREPFPLPGIAEGAPKGLYQHMFSGTGFREADKR